MVSEKKKRRGSAQQCIRKFMCTELSALALTKMYHPFGKPVVHFST